MVNVAKLCPRFAIIQPACPLTPGRPSTDADGLLENVLPSFHFKTSTKATRKAVPLLDAPCGDGDFHRSTAAPSPDSSSAMADRAL